VALGAKSTRHTPLDPQLNLMAPLPRARLFPPNSFGKTHISYRNLYGLSADASAHAGISARPVLGRWRPKRFNSE
jgi:hypothetical protein